MGPIEVALAGAQPRLTLAAIRAANYLVAQTDILQPEGPLIASQAALEVVPVDLALVAHEVDAAKDELAAERAVEHWIEPD